MADQNPVFFQPNTLDNMSQGGVGDSGAKPGPQDMQGGPNPNTTSGPSGDVPGSSPNKPAPDFMR